MVLLRGQSILCVVLLRGQSTVCAVILRGQSTVCAVNIKGTVNTVVCGFIKGTVYCVYWFY